VENQLVYIHKLGQTSKLGMSSKSCIMSILGFDLGETVCVSFRERWYTLLGSDNPGCGQAD
jgi:hypothetical protein